MKLDVSALTPVTPAFVVLTHTAQLPITSLNVFVMNHSPEMRMMLNKGVHYCHQSHSHVHLMIHVLMEMCADHSSMERKVVSMPVKMFHVDRMQLVK